MAKLRRTLRKVEPGEWHTFDEELWPINVALIVLAGFVAGAIIAVSQFDDPRWLYNGWFRLTTLILSTGALLVVANKFASRRVRRAMQLSAVLAILAHVVMITILYNQRLKYMEELAEADITVYEADVTLPEYLEPETEEPQEYEKPVETETPEPEREMPLERQETETEIPEESQPTPEPGTTPQVEPNPVERAEVQEAAPRRSETQSQRSRQTAQAQPLPTEALATPQAATPTEAAPSEPQPEAQSVNRTAQALPTVTTKPATPEAAPTAQPKAAELARRSTQEPTPQEAASKPTLNRAINQPLAVPKLAAANPQPIAVSPAANPQELTPNAVEVTRQSLLPNVASQPASEPRAAASVEITKLDSARQTPAEAPQLASAPERAAEKAPSAAIAPSPADAPVDSPEANQPADQPAVAQAAPAPSQTAAERQSAQTPTANPNPAASAEPASNQPAAVASAALARAQAAEAPSINPQSAPAAAPNRATQTAQAPASPQNIEAPSVAVAEAVRSEASPTRSALSRGTAGIAGVGRSANFDQGESAPLSPVAVASASAKRAEASQREPIGPALAPSAPALVAKSIAGANVPQATVAAQDIEVANVAGVKAPSMVEASSSAAVQRADASAPAGKVTADAGQTEFDIGPTQIVSQIAGVGRPAGGGVPEMRLDRQGPAFSRQPSSGAPLASLAAADVAEAPQAPAATGGGAPQPQASGTTAAAARTAAGGVAAVAAPSSEPAAAAPATGVVAGSLARSASSADVPPSSQPAPGGPTQTGREVSRVALAETKADAPMAAVGPAVGQTATGGGLEAPGDIVVRSAAGLPGRTVSQPIGVAAGEVPIDTAASGAAAVGGSLARAETGNADAPAAMNVAAAGGPARATTAAQLPIGPAAAIDAPAADLPVGETGGTGASAPAPSVAAVDAAASRSAAAVPIQVAAVDGVGGLALDMTPDVGSISRQARRDSELVHPSVARFLARTAGGPLAIDGRAREPAQAFSRRRGRQIDPTGEYGQPPERTEKAIELGLDFLARHQAPDGSWSLHNYGQGRRGYERETSQLRSDTAATGLALLAFFGAGYDHFDDDYAGQIRNGLQYLLKTQKPDGDLYLPMDAESNKSVWLYSHGIATIALCEAYGMTGDDDLKEPAQKAIDFIVAAQHAERGGWRYVPGRESDTSVSGWQLMALKSGELSGLTVPAETYTRVDRWLDKSQTSPDGKTQYAYNPFAPLQTAPGRFADQGRRPTPATTSMGLLMRLYTGWNRDDARLRGGCDFLLSNPPQMGTARNPQRDSYYWYYATQLMFHMKGDYWKQWNSQLHPLLVDQQITTGPLAGSWDPRRPVPDRWGVLGGRMYVTTLNLLTLEVFYRHLPIYEQTAK